MTSRSDDAEQAYYLDLCARIQACRDRWDYSADEQFVFRLPASEAHLQAVEATLGVAIPPLLRLLYREVADGGSMLTHPWQELVEAADLPDLLNRSGWRLHPAIERGLQRHRGCWVLCDSWPEGFLHIGMDGHCSLLLDTVTGWIYVGEIEGVLPWRRQGQRIDLQSLKFTACSLGDLCEGMLAHYGFRERIPRGSGTHGALAGEWEIRGQLTSGLLDADRLEDEAHVWHGLYPGVDPLSWTPPGRADTQPSDEADDLAGRDEPFDDEGW